MKSDNQLYEDIRYVVGVLFRGTDHSIHEVSRIHAVIVRYLKRKKKEKDRK